MNGVGRCPSCGHALHEGQVCLNIASDNDCSCDTRTLEQLLEQMEPWQRDIYEQLVAAGPGAHVIWQGGRRGGKFMIKRALELRAEQEKQHG